MTVSLTKAMADLALDLDEQRPHHPYNATDILACAFGVTQSIIELRLIKARDAHDIADYKMQKARVDAAWKVFQAGLKITA